jgi:hypothetical protein
LGLEGVGATELRHCYPHKLVLHFTLCLVFILDFELLQKMQQLKVSPSIYHKFLNAKTYVLELQQ